MGVGGVAIKSGRKTKSALLVSLYFTSIILMKKENIRRT